MRRGFTLLEIIIVIIILGILATLGFTQYTQMIEKGRTAEAKANLGSLRSLEVANYQEYGAHDTVTNVGSGLPDGACNTTYYFSYTCPAGAGTGGVETCTATRCTAGGKTPNAATAYSITLDTNGNMAGTAGYY